MRNAAAISFLMLAASSAFALEPDEFKDLKLGMALETVEGLNLYGCSEHKRPVADQMCILKPGQRQTIAGKDVASMALLFYERRLAAITITVNPDSIDEINAALVVKYGEPTSRTESIFETRSGTKYPNVRTQWSGAASQTVTERRALNADRGVVRISTADYLKQFTIRTERQRAKNAADL